MWQGYYKSVPLLTNAPAILQNWVEPSVGEERCWPGRPFPCVIAQPVISQLMQADVKDCCGHSAISALIWGPCKSPAFVTWTLWEHSLKKDCAQLTPIYEISCLICLWLELINAIKPHVFMAGYFCRVFLIFFLSQPWRQRPECQKPAICWPHLKQLLLSHRFCWCWVFLSPGQRVSKLSRCSRPFKMKKVAMRERLCI